METSVNSVWTTRGGYPVSIDVSALPGKKLIDRSGHKIGKITAIEVGRESGHADFMKVRRGGLWGYGTEWFLEPVDRVIAVNGHTVTID